MSAKPWENRLMEQGQNDLPETTPPPSKTCAPTGKSSSSPDLVKVRRNNVTTRISARPLRTRLSSSSSSDYRYDHGSSGSSSFCTSTTLVSMERTEESKPSYMSLTESTKAKQRNPSPRIYRQSMDDFPLAEG
ncbi:hypothetical protein LXL04_039077 [Taraxacum kok-saghyz]